MIINSNSHFYYIHKFSNKNHIMCRHFFIFFIFFCLSFYSPIVRSAASWLDHFCSPPLCRTPTGLTAQAPASDPTISMTIRVRVYTAAHILLTSACMAARDVLSVGFSAYSASCTPLPSPRRCIGTAPRSVLSHASRFRQRPECVEIDAWANCWCRDAFISRNPPFLCREKAIVWVWVWVGGGHAEHNGQSQRGKDWIH